MLKSDETNHTEHQNGHLNNIDNGNLVNGKNEKPRDHILEESKL